MRISDWSSDVCSSDLDKEPPDSWRPLLYRIAVNVAIDQQRIATTHRAAAHVPSDRVLHAVPSGGLAPDERLDRQQLLARMWEVVNAMPPRCRDIYLLSPVEGMPQRRIPETYTISDRKRLRSGKRVS